MAIVPQELWRKQPSGNARYQNDEESLIEKIAAYQVPLRTDRIMSRKLYAIQERVSRNLYRKRGMVSGNIACSTKSLSPHNVRMALAQSGISPASIPRWDNHVLHIARKEVGDEDAFLEQLRHEHSGWQQYQRYYRAQWLVTLAWFSFFIACGIVSRYILDYLGAPYLLSAIVVYSFYACGVIAMVTVGIIPSFTISWWRQYYFGDDNRKFDTFRRPIA